MSLKDDIAVVPGAHSGCVTNVVWAVPTSGYGHVADEQALPFINVAGEELTPRLGGEPDQCPFEAIGLPWGKLTNSWPMRQRLHNYPRKAINRYWRELFKSRNRSDGRFLFGEQLDYKRTTDGYIGRSPLIHHQRSFRISGRSIEVCEVIDFRNPVEFDLFAPVVLPLHVDWKVGVHAPRWIELNSVPQGRWDQRGIACSTGAAVLWSLIQERVMYESGQVLMFSYIYRF